MLTRNHNIYENRKSVKIEKEVWSVEENIILVY